MSSRTREIGVSTSNPSTISPLASGLGQTFSPGPLLVMTPQRSVWVGCSFPNTMSTSVKADKPRLDQDA